MTVKNQHVDACHCDMCRRWCGGPGLAVFCQGAPEFEGEPPLGVYQSSEWAERLFCKTCGSSLFYRLIAKGDYVAYAGSLDLSDDARMTVEIFVDEQPGYYAFAGERKRMTGAEVFAEFASGQES
ncbi:MAG: GFA family protein [Pseudomonadota bacterium]